MDRRRYDLVFSIYLNSEGFGWVLFEGPSYPVEWGTVRQQGKAKNARCFQKAVELIERLRPDVIVVEKIVAAFSNRTARVVKLSVILETYLEGLGIPFFRYSREDIRKAFGNLPSPSKDGIAEAISKSIPVLFRFVPPKRKPWKSQDARMGLFDAAALALTHFQNIDAQQ
ncbi:hypothetical protein X744_22465 [Mesorhizobium sp. LNJC372A00]|nr:hypothetical protein X745_20910 [Mesorhizobium sp. LNJC374B00]ESY55993.1 hypothetical protein X744_22465 [Mesorhizobium sp. LNJC372A00]